MPEPWDDEEVGDDLEDLEVLHDADEDEASDVEGSADTEGEVSCPWCGEVNVVAVDPGGGDSQEYVEDCQVCCRPWTVHVTFDEEGRADVVAEAQGDWDD